MSDMGSVTGISEAAFPDTRQVAQECLLTEYDAAYSEVAHVSPRATGDEASVSLPYWAGVSGEHVKFAACCHALIERPVGVVGYALEFGASACVFFSEALTLLLAFY